MDLREIQRLAAANVNPERYKALAAHGEDLLVERKAGLPAVERLGAEVASMANMIGGWLLLGVDDRSRELVALDLPKGIDLQSHIGHLLRNAIDPVPPFLADTLEVDGATVGFVRVFESSVPVLVAGQGAVYTRDAGGKIPVSDHRALLELAARGRQAEHIAGERAQENQLTQRLLGIAGNGEVQPNYLRSAVRAAPLTVTPQLAEWPISSGPQSCLEAVNHLGSHIGGAANSDATVRPFGRAVFTRVLSPQSSLSSVEARTVADCAGLIGASTSQPINNIITTYDFRRRYVRPLIDAVAFLLERAEAYGDAVLDLTLLCGRAVALQDPNGDPLSHDLPRRTHCGSAILFTPADEEDKAELAKRWEREIAREVGIALWES